MPRKLHTAALDRGRALADFLAGRLGLPRTEVDELVRAGAVYVGATRVLDPSAVLGAGQRVTVHVEPPGREPGPELEPVVVYRDGEVLVVDKPAGVPTQATRERAAGALDRAVRERFPEARLLHRIDRDASGLVLFTLGEEARRRFAAMLGDGALERWYRAVAWGHVAGAGGSLDRPIGPDPDDRRRMAAGAGRPALTRFLVERFGRTPGGAPTTLLTLQLVTGRRHQIRVHLADAGHPLCGDPRYGPPPPHPVPRLCLHAERLRWPGREDDVTSPAPALFDQLVR